MCLLDLNSGDKYIVISFVCKLEVIFSVFFFLRVRSSEGFSYYLILDHPTDGGFVARDDPRQWKDNYPLVLKFETKIHLPRLSELVIASPRCSELEKSLIQFAGSPKNA